VFSHDTSRSGTTIVTIRRTIALAAALAIVGTAPALAAPKAPDTVSLAAKKKKRVVRTRHAAPQGQIACGPAGCHRIPPNCSIQGTVLDWHGNPTGIDDVRCR
jgi:hypothetical protein